MFGRLKNWLNERLRKMPLEDLDAAHRHSFHNREALLASEICGCFHCEKIFAPEKIAEWCDTDENGICLTALCPYCGIDSLMGSQSGFPITEEFLSRMRKRWF